jgi:hypothetical protein
LAILSSLDTDTAAELQGLVNFVNTMVVKQQEVADSFEPEALLRAGQTYGAAGSGPTSNWVQRVVQIVFGTGQVILARDPRWVAVAIPEAGSGGETAVAPDGTVWTASGSGWIDGLGHTLDQTGAGWNFAGAAPNGGPEAGIDPSLGVWLKGNDNRWANLATGISLPTADPSWVLVAMPSGTACLIDPVNKRALVSYTTWVDTTTGEVSAGGPALAQNQFPQATFDTGIYPVGLSALIPTSQDYVTARILQATGTAPLTSAVVSHLAAYQVDPSSFSSQEAVALLLASGGLQPDLQAQSDQISNWVSVREAKYVLSDWGYVLSGLPSEPTLAQFQSFAQAYIGNLGLGRANSLELAIQAFASQGTIVFDSQGAVVEDDRWEDTRQPLFVTLPSGNVLTDGNGNPVPNPLRLTFVPFVGEKNDYYRRLVKDNGIDPFSSRTVPQFGIIAPGASTALDSVAASNFMSIYSQCVRVFYAAYYEPAYLKDNLYLSWCRMFIAWMAIRRAMDERMKGFGDIDRMGQWDVTNLLYSYGLYDYDDMPLAYKRVFLKNIEKILSDKGTSQVFTDILGMFNLSSEVNVFSYYLVKHFPSAATEICFGTPTVDQSLQVTLAGVTYSSELVASNPEIHQSITVAGVLSDLAAQLSLVSGILSAVVASSGTCLLINTKAGSGLTNGSFTGDVFDNSLGEIISEATVTFGPTDYTQPSMGFLKSTTSGGVGPVELSTMAGGDSLLGYDNFTSTDPTWMLTEAQAAALPLSVLETKYFSVEAALDVASNGFAMSFLWSALQRAELEGSAANLQVGGASGLAGVSGANLFEMLVAALILLLYQFGVDDLVPYSEDGVRQILAARTDGLPFPQEGSLLPYTTRLGMIEDYGTGLDIGNVVTMVTGNISLSDQIQASSSVIGRGYTPEVQAAEAAAPGAASVYDRSGTVRNLGSLKNLWNFKFIGTIQTAVWGDSVRYSDWLSTTNPGLGSWVSGVEAASAGDPTAYSTAILQVTSLLEDAVSNSAFNFSIALGSIDIILTYVHRMIIFFKSYTSDLKDFATSIVMDDESTDGIQLVNSVASFYGALEGANYSDGDHGHRGEYSWLWDRAYPVVSTGFSDGMVMADAPIMTPFGP